MPRDRLKTPWPFIALYATEVFLFSLRFRCFPDTLDVSTAKNDRGASREPAKNARQILQLALQTKPCELQTKDSRSLQRSTTLFVYRSLCLLCASTMRFVLASSIKMACFMDTVRSLRHLSMKRTDFMDMSNIS